ncbi:hypothetical protein [Peribacillus simplex]|nr:hypothetical protein [Peribacillus simplex]
MSGTVERNWTLEKVFVIGLPNHDKRNANDHHRKTLLSGVHINI